MLLSLASVAPLTLFGPLFAAAPPAAVPAQETLINEAYRFKITANDRTLSLLERKDAAGVAPDAIAGVVQDNGAWAILIAEYVPGQDLDAYSELVTSGMADSPGIENAEFGEITKTKHDGLDARSRSFTMVISELDVRYRHVTYAKDDYVFQILSWGEQTLCTVEDLVAVTGMFSVLPGKITGGRGAVPLHDADGVGWRQRKGIFESALVGIRLEPRGPWRVVVDPELDNMDVSADVGLVLVEPDTYCALTVYEGAGGDGSESIADKNRHWEEEMELAPSGDPVEMKLAGSAIQLTPYLRENGMSVRFLQGSTLVGDSLVQVEAWCVAAAADQGFAALQEGLAGLSFLESGARRKLESELLDAPDPEFMVGSDFVLRNGVYTDFKHGFRIAKPREFWDFDSGAEARSNGDAVRLMAYKMESDLRVAVEVTPWEDTDLLLSHTTSLVDEWEVFPSASEVPKPAELELGGVRFLSTVVAAENDAGESFPRMRVLTALKDGKRYELSARSSAPGLGDHDQGLAALWGSFTFDAPSRIEVSDQTYIDRGLGFELRAPSKDWKGEAMSIPGSVDAINSCYTWKSRRGRLLLVIGLGVGSDADLDLIVGSIIEAMVEEGGGKVTRREGTFQGEPANLVETKRLLSKTFFTSVERGGRRFVIGCAGPSRDDLAEIAERCVVIED